MVAVGRGTSGPKICFRRIPDTRSRALQKVKDLLQIALSVEISVPAVVLEHHHLLLRESLAVADGHVAFDVADGAHAWDDGRDGRMAQDVSERYLGYLILARSELGDDGPHTVVDLLFAPAAEVVVAEISLFEGGIGCDPARQGALVEGYPDYHADVVFL